MTTDTYQEVLDFWFKETDSEFWFKQNDQVDNDIRQRFGHLHQKAAACELVDWRESIHGRLA